jgi:hypothetical protein
MAITIDKAIKNLNAGRLDCGMIPEEEFTQTMDLAAEGLKAVKAYRRNLLFPGDDLLRGEAPE